MKLSIRFSYVLVLLAAFAAGALLAEENDATSATSAATSAASESDSSVDLRPAAPTATSETSSPAETPAPVAPVVETAPEQAPVPKSAPVSADEQPVKSTETPPAASPPKAEKIVAPPKSAGTPQGECYIGHRFYEEKGAGWGWIKKQNEPWTAAKWVALKEDPNHDNGGVVAPFRKLAKRSADNDYEYKFYGRFASYDAYDPHLDEAMPVFVLQAYESLGPAKQLDRKPGPPGRFSRQHRSRASSRDSSPIQSDRDSDSF